MLNLCWHYIHRTDNLRVLDTFHLHAMGVFYLFFYNKDERHLPRKKRKKSLLTFVSLAFSEECFYTKKQ